MKTLLTKSNNLLTNKKVLFFGDSSAERSIYLNTLKSSIISLPINDNSIKLAFRKHKTFDTIFFHCTYPLVGCKEIERIKNVQNNNIDSRTFSYRHKPENKEFYNDNWWKNLSDKDVSFLFNNWLQIIDYYYQQNSNMVLLPIRAHYYDWQLDLPVKAREMLSDFDRIVDLSPLDNHDKGNYIDKFGNLSKQGFSIIENDILQWLNFE